MWGISCGEVGSGDRFRRRKRKRAISTIRSMTPPMAPPTMAPMLGPEEAALVLLLALVLVSIAGVVVEVEVELLLPFPSTLKMVESRRSEKPSRGEVKLAPPFSLFPTRKSDHARWNKENKGRLTLRQ